MKQNLRAAGCVKVYADLLRKSMRLLTNLDTRRVFLISTYLILFQ